MIVRNHHCLLLCKDFFGDIHCALGSTERTTLPQVMIKGFIFLKEQTPTSLAQRGLTRDYLPYNSSVLGIETMPVPHQWGLFKSIL